MDDDTRKRAVWSRYVAEITERVGPQAVANKIKAQNGFGPSQPTVSRWLRGQHLPKSAEAAILARTYKSNVLAAFVAAGFISTDEADRGLSAADLALLSMIGVGDAFGSDAI